MFHYLSVTVALLALNADPTQARCADSPIEWNNNNITCPDRAICGETTETAARSDSGNSCLKARVVSHCICPGNRVCPINSDAHMLYLTTTKKQYLCTPKCTLPWCSNLAPTLQRVTSLTRQSEDLEYYKMECRCPRHHFPVGSSWRDRAVKYGRQNKIGPRRYTAYYCDTKDSDGIPSDPCRPQ